MFYDYLIYSASSQIFPVDFILLPFPEYFRGIVNISIYLTKYREATPLMIKQKLFSV